MTLWSTLIAIAVGLTLGLIIMKLRGKDHSNVYVLTLKDFVTNMRKGQLVDIRKKQDFEIDHIKGARNFTKAKLTHKKVNLRKDLSVYVYCANGRSSHRAAKKLSDNGFKDIYVLQKGFANYTENK